MLMQAATSMFEGPQPPPLVALAGPVAKAIAPNAIATTPNAEIFLRVFTLRESLVVEIF
jgi:hypothetical protein